MRRPFVRGGAGFADTTAIVRSAVDAAMRQLVGAEAELIRGLSRGQVATVVEALRTIATVSAKPAPPRTNGRRTR